MAIGAQHSAAGPRAVLARQVDPPVCHLWLNAERTLVFAEEIAVDPDRPPSGGGQRKGRCWRLSVHRSVNDRDAIRSRSTPLRRIELTLPLQLPGRQRERIHVRVEVLEINDAVLHHRSRGQRAVRGHPGCGFPGQLERPGLHPTAVPLLPHAATTTLAATSTAPTVRWARTVTLVFISTPLSTLPSSGAVAETHPFNRCGGHWCPESPSHWPAGGRAWAAAPPAWASARRR